MTTYFGVTTTDVRKKRNPGNDPSMFQVGSGAGEYPAADLESKIADWDEYAASRLPEKYRRMLARCNGEVIVDYATGASLVSATLGLAPVTAASVVLYRNYFTGRRDYGMRAKSDAMDASLYSVTGSTGVVAFSPALNVGDQVIADYTHAAAASIRYLRKVVIALVVADLIEEYPTMGDTANKVDELRKQAYGDLDRLRTGASGLHIFDDLSLVDEYETRNADGTVGFGMAGGLV